MLTKCYIALVLALISSPCNASNGVKCQENQTTNNNKIVGKLKTKPGQNLEWHVPNVSCSVTYGHLKAICHDPKFNIMTGVRTRAP